MKKIAALMALFILLAVPGVVSAEPFDTKHRIYVGLGGHAFWPEDDEQEGVRPDQDGFVTNDEWAYIFDEGYDISDFNGLTFLIGYEYNFFHWFGLAADFGRYGGTSEYDFHVEGIHAETDFTLVVWHLNVLPRFHWQTRWTDLYGGPVLGFYNGRVDFDVDAQWRDFHFNESDSDRDNAFGWGLDLGFEVRIIRNFGVGIEGRSMISLMFKDTEHTEPFNAGGNTFLLTAIAHF